MIMHQLDARIRKLKAVLAGYRVRNTVDVEGIEISPRGKNEYVPFQNRDYWAKTEGENWYDFRFTATVPEGFTGQARLCADTGMDGWEATMSQMVVWVNGRIEQAFDTRHLSLILQDEAKPGESFQIFIQAYHNTKRNGAGLMVPRMRFFLADWADDVCQLYYDIDVPHSAALLEKTDSRDRELTLKALSDACNLLDLRRPFSPEFHASIKAARDYLKENYYDKLKDIEPESVAECIGHTHIDVAWLWDIYQTRHKAVRTFATMLKLMQQYPEFKFMSSQAQLYQFVKEDQPELFSRIQQAVREGRWEAEGGMWVEADCNLSGGEALVRQFLYGNEFFETELGVRSRILWLPDVFGYSAALPQILKKSGIDYFLTSKLSWSEFNKSPYDTFSWKGIDGSKVLTHFLPAREYGGEDDYERHDDLQFFTTYNAMLEPNQIKGGWKRFQQKGLDNHFLVSYGFGDGGGGSTDWMIENARRMKYPVAGCPAVKQSFARDFFEALDKRVSGDKRLPVWSGELYLEYHRGTYTSQGKNKRNNRKLELALRDLEFWLTKAGGEYPQDEMRNIWRNMLTLQFHDILPGSSIHKVYTDSDETYADLFKRVDALKQNAVKRLMKDAKGDVILTNTLSSSRSDLVWFDAPAGVCALRTLDGREFAAQKVEDRYVAYVEDLKPMSATPMFFVYGNEGAPRVKLDEKGFETAALKGEFDSDMFISSLVDKDADRQLVKPGQKLNSLVYYENRPHNYDAWDINIYYREKSWQVEKPVEVKVISVGPVAGVIRVKWLTGDSAITQDYIIPADIKRVDFSSDIDWQEPHGLLKTHFPVDVFYNQAQFDIQYGNVTRATHKNTSWDVARFEVCAHKWMDVSEAAYGAAILSDCKYGYSVDEDSVALSLVKSATDPDSTADIGKHVFSYSLMPHCGDWRQANVPEAGYRFNIPVEAIKAENGNRDVSFAFACVDRPNVMIETVKAALHGEGTIIRLYECFGARTKATLTLEKAPEAACFTSLMEDDLETAGFKGNSIELEFKPYEIVTLRIK
ncbi:MAG: alpha-mannosidase [Clostridia bacterium]|nr:alpha-mannosidase [Clostridia bacterium]